MTEPAPRNTGRPTGARNPADPARSPTDAMRPPATDHRGGSPVLGALATAIGATFLLVGALGFVPGVTTGLYDQLDWYGHRSGAELLGLFQVSVLHNGVHLLFGVAGLAAATRASRARAYLVGGGLVYLALWIYGLLVHASAPANVVPLNTADDWLHLGLGVGMVGLGLSLGPRRRTRALGTPAPRRR